MLSTPTAFQDHGYSAQPLGAGDREGARFPTATPCWDTALARTSLPWAEVWSWALG